MVRAVAAFAVMLGGSVLGGCSTYLPEYQYAPHPAVVEIPLNLQPPATQPMATPPAGTQPAGTQPAMMPPMATNEPPAMQVMALVVGVRRARNHLPEAVEIRVRLENGPLPAAFDSSRLQLVTESLVTLGPPQVFPSEAVALAPGQQVVVEGIFPLPPGMSDETLDLTGLRLSVPLSINGKAVQAGMNFSRVNPYYLYDPNPYYYPYYGPYYYPYPTFYGRFYFRGGGHFRR